MIFAPTTTVLGTKYPSSDTLLGEGAQGGGGASSDGDDPEAEVRQTMQSSDFQKFCSLCQMQGQGDVFAICRQQLAQHAVYAQGACMRARMHAWAWAWAP